MKTSLNLTEKQSRQSRNPFQSAFKRLFDIAGSAACLVLLTPVYAGVAASILAEDGRPVLFKQKRTGKDGVTFDIYKFRSMKVQQASGTGKTADDKYNWPDRVPDDFVFKPASLDNPNITKAGKFIRKYSLDELPQLYNVLKGDMSLIGPRPEIIEITRCYDAQQRERLTVKPGITGWAQVNGRSSMNHGEKIKHDLYYVNNTSLTLDIKIIIKTATQVLLGKNAS